MMQLVESRTIRVATRRGPRRYYLRLWMSETSAPVVLVSPVCDGEEPGFWTTEIANHVFHRYLHYAVAFYYLECDESGSFTQVSFEVHRYRHLAMKQRTGVSAQAVVNLTGDLGVTKGINE
jgi:hypothetical protein